MKTFYTICLFSMITVFGYAETPQSPQEPPAPRPQSPQGREQHLRRVQSPQSSENRQAFKQKVQAHRVAYFTEKLALTPAEAEKFWALYNTFQRERDRLINEMVQKTHSRRDTNGHSEFDVSNLSDAEARQLVANRGVQIDLEMKFHNDLTKLFSPQRVLAFYDAERGFQRELMNMRTPASRHNATPPSHERQRRRTNE